VLRVHHRRTAPRWRSLRRSSAVQVYAMRLKLHRWQRRRVCKGSDSMSIEREAFCRVLAASQAASAAWEAWRVAYFEHAQAVAAFRATVPAPGNGRVSPFRFHSASNSDHPWASGRSCNKLNRDSARRQREARRFPADACVRRRCLGRTPAARWWRAQSPKSSSWRARPV